MPGGEKFIMHILAAVAEHERDQISQRTTLALQAAKVRGVELGTYGRDVLSKKNRELSHLFAKGMQPTIIRLRREGFKTIRVITVHIPTYRNDGSKWHVSTVHKIINQTNKNHNICVNKLKISQTHITAKISETSY